MKPQGGGDLYVPN